MMRSSQNVWKISCIIMWGVRNFSSTGSRCVWLTGVLRHKTFTTRMICNNEYDLPINSRVRTPYLDQWLNNRKWRVTGRSTSRSLWLRVGRNGSAGSDSGVGVWLRACVAAVVLHLNVSLTRHGGTGRHSHLIIQSSPAFVICLSTASARKSTIKSGDKECITSFALTTGRSNGFSWGLLVHLHSL